MVPQGQKLLSLLIFAVFPGTILGIQFRYVINDHLRIQIFGKNFKYNICNFRIEMLAILPLCQHCGGGSRL